MSFDLLDADCTHFYTLIRQCSVILCTHGSLKDLETGAVSLCYVEFISHFKSALDIASVMYL